MACTADAPQQSSSDRSTGVPPIATTADTPTVFDTTIRASAPSVDLEPGWSLGADSLRILPDCRGRKDRTVVSETPPDSVPSGVDDETKLVVLPTYGWTVRDIVVLVFTTDATAEDRSAAVDQVCGEVIGGRYARYYIRIPSDGTKEPLLEAVRRLKRLPQVSTVDVLFGMPKSAIYD